MSRCQEMLRYFYILICIHVSLSYDIIEKKRLRAVRGHGGRRGKAGQIDTNKVVQLDMQSFMNSDDDSQDYEPFDFDNSKLNRRSQNEDYYESPINKFKREENTDYSAFKDRRGDAAGAMAGDSLNVRAFDAAVEENDLLEDSKHDTDRHVAQEPEKKCAFHSMKVPFFSHKTAKQVKRRNLSCINCGVRYTKGSESESNTRIDALVRRLKTAYGNVCPTCIQKLLQRYHRNKLSDGAKEIHNSKDFYKKIGTTEGRKGRDGTVFDYFTIDDRRKRDDVQERQMKELAEVEMKVDKVRITTPKAGEKTVVVSDFN